MIELLDSQKDCGQVISRVLGYLKDQGINQAQEGFYKPWGLSVKIDDSEIEAFLESNFRHPILEKRLKSIDLKDISPRVLIIQPGKQLSWQVHSRRSEWWRIISGPVGAVLSKTDSIPDKQIVLQAGTPLVVDRDIRHRLQGLNNWGVVAEIWVNSDPSYPTDKDDIRRISDDYGRLG